MRDASCAAVVGANAPARERFPYARARLPRVPAVARAPCSVPVTAVRQGRRRSGRRRGLADGGEARGGNEEVLEALTGHLAGAVAGERVEQVTVVSDLAAVSVADHGNPAAQPGGDGRGR